MEKKTKVELIDAPTGSPFKIGARGYADGYVSHKNVVHAIVVVDDKIDNIPLHCLRVIKKINRTRKPY